MSVLNELYNGDICPSEKFIRKNSAYYKLNCGLMEKIEKFTKQLNKEDKNKFDEIEDAAISLCALCEEERYIEGFCTGAKMMWEIINHKSENLK